MDAFIEFVTAIDGSATWSATLSSNGGPEEDVPIHRANVCFRAIPIPPGDVSVAFRFRPPGMSLGLTVSTLAMALFAWTTARWGTGWRRGSRSPEGLARSAIPAFAGG